MTQVLISEQFKEKPQQDIKISVITVCKNSAAHIEKAIQSVINQTYKDIEYIVIIKIFTGH
jgi:GT2 family glycosyltransferase